MRICIVSSSFYPATSYGGPISATWDLSRKLAKKGIKVYVSTTNANGNSKLNETKNTFIKKDENLFVKYYNEQLINKLSLSFLFGIWSDIKNSDVVYIQYVFHYTVPFALLCSVFLNKKIILCPRGSLGEWGLQYKWKSIKKIWVSLFLRPFISKITMQASSYIEKDDILRNYPNAKVKIINDGVDFISFQNAQKLSRKEIIERFSDSTCDDVSNIFFSMGRLHEIKGFDVIIDAFSLYLKDDKNAKLIIAGADDGVKSNLEFQILDLQLQESVFLIGEVGFENKKLLLNNCDYFTLASEFESFGIVIAEALSCGKPVILSNKTPWKDLEINKCGILADNDKISFFNAFTKIVNEKYDSKMIKSYVRSNYDWEVIVDRFIRILKNK